MKVRTALKQSQQHLTFLLPATVVAWGIVLVWFNSVLVALASILTLATTGEAINILYIRRKAARNPALMDERIN